jgi:hypothetical protein
MSPNQNPEQIARDAIDAQLRAAGWAVQAKDAIDFHAGEGQAVREYSTDTGPADYVLFIDGQPVGITEAKKETLGANITTVEEQTSEYASAKLRYIQSSGIPLPFLYEATGVITRFTDQRDPKPRSREVFAFHRPETLREFLAAGRSLRARLHDLPALDPTHLRECQIEAVTNLEVSLKDARPRALIQMATGAGKPFTAITSVYRLLKHARVRRVLFLVDMLAAGKEEVPAARESRDQEAWSAVERFAEETASHTLVPEPMLAQEISAGGYPRNGWDIGDVRSLARRFKITPLAMATRLRASGYFDWKATSTKASSRRTPRTPSPAPANISRRAPSSKPWSSASLPSPANPSPTPPAAPAASSSRPTITS